MTKTELKRQALEKALIALGAPLSCRYPGGASLWHLPGQSEWRLVLVGERGRLAMTADAGIVAPTKEERQLLECVKAKAERILAEVQDSA